jgi:bifunctional DNA-binding transcriptional regulator/antitoxin component of YhaV-PrlF toxin-antitoxin module
VTDYKKYSLGQLENFLHDAMSAAEATPQEIYDVIKGVVEENYYTYKHQASQAYELLALLNGNGVGHLTCDKDDTSEECKKSWNDFWVEDLHRTDYTEEELNAMCDAAEAKDKVNKWIIPVDDDYNITFPEDLLEQTGWKEGDVLEWIDQGDGSFKMVKKEKKEHPSWVRGNELAKVKTYQEMIDDGWTMTDDGFWIKEN